MKIIFKIIRITIVAFSALLLIYSTASISYAAKKAPVYIVGVATNFTPQKNVQFAQSFKDMFAVLAGQADIKIKIKDYANITDLRKAINKKEIDFVFIGDRLLAIESMSKGTYRPFISYSAYGRSLNRFCIFSASKLDTRDIEDLHGKTISLLNSEFPYFMLRDLLDSPPEKFFSKLNVKKNDISLFYTISLEESELAYGPIIIYEFLKQNNPGVVKNIVPLYCSAPNSFVPFIVKSTVPEETVERIQKIIVNMRKSREFRKFWPLIDNLELKYFKIDKSSYSQDFLLMEKANKQNWNKDFREAVKKNSNNEK